MGRNANQVKFECAYCGIEFYRAASKKRRSRSGLFFCCREHKDLAQRLGGCSEIQPPHYGTARITDYRALLERSNREYKCANIECGYNKYPILEVHHIDGNRTNNDLENLEYRCPNCHDEIHYLSKTGMWSSRNMGV